jgi:hypothetical protein
MESLLCLELAFSHSLWMDTPLVAYGFMTIMVSRNRRVRDLDERSAAYGIEDNTYTHSDSHPACWGYVFDSGILVA